MKRVCLIIFSVLLATLFIIGNPSKTHSISKRIQPTDLIYLGAFRLPEGESGSEVRTWAWGGFAMTYYPNGDFYGANDGYPGSIFATGHAWEYQVSEISIPAPIISTTKNLEELNIASTIQNFQDILEVSQLEIPRVGLAYLPQQGSQTTDKLYFCYGEHMQESGTMTHGWCELNLNNPQIKRGWYLDTPHYEYNTNDYMFNIPFSWASSYSGGKILATGRFRDGGWSGQGPALYAIAPWNQGNPPPNGTSLQYITLLKYTSSEDPESWEESTNHTINNYHHSDEWSGGVWLTSGEKSSVVFIGTKGTGDCWYGDSNGPCYDCEGERGWWSTGFEGQFIFYDPDDLAKVATGEMEPWEPQPYASLNVDQYLYHIDSSQQWYHLGAACFDSDHGFLYVFEPYVDNDKPIIHVWQLASTNIPPSAEISINRTQLNFGATSSTPTPGPQNFTISNRGIGTMYWEVSDNKVWINITPSTGTNSGSIEVSIDSTGLSPGEYTGNIIVSSANASNSPQTIAVKLNVYWPQHTSDPFGAFSSPEDNSTVFGSVPITGWALDDLGIEGVQIYRYDNNSMVFIGDAVFVDGARPDVQETYSNYPMNYRAGWGYMMLSNFLPNSGNGTYTLSAIATDKEGHQIVLGSKNIICDNANAVKPFGAIDTPLQGGTASGNGYINWGWVLTPQPNSIANDGSKIHVFVDGVNLGHPTYNIYRSDIATLFPGYANSDGPVGYFTIDTSIYNNGIHTISWIATDNAGNTDGIGSRYFQILNTNNTQKKKYKKNSNSIQFFEHTSLSKLPVIYDLPIKVKRGNKPFFQLIYPSSNKNRNTIIYVCEGENLEIHFFPDIPDINSPITSVSRSIQFDIYPRLIGSTIDNKKGIFYWIPPPGFFGEYPLTILQKNKTIGKRLLKIIVRSKFHTKIK